jgi:KTSC domain-containing protein
MKVELFFPESDQIYKIFYETSDESLNVQFHNADWYSYKAVPSELIKDWTKAASAGSFFHARIKPVYIGAKWHTGTLAERVEIWLRSKAAKQYAGFWVALGMGHPIDLIGFADTEKEAAAAAGIIPSVEFVVVQVPGRQEANRYDV